MESSFFLSLSNIEGENKCLICNKTFRRKDKIQCFGVNGWPKFKEEAEKWNKLKIYKDNYKQVNTLAHSKLKGTELLFGKLQTSCKREFGLRYMNSATKLGEKNPTENDKFLSVIFLGYSL